MIAQYVAHTEMFAPSYSGCANSLGTHEVLGSSLLLLRSSPVSPASERSSFSSRSLLYSSSLWKVCSLGLGGSTLSISSSVVAVEVVGCEESVVL